ncbi:gastrula zinc finger protein XlCGF8.2DB-like [Ostrinia furnacalis]|uniref:gastrula zinc finger protein XlCGF8.2DB-like n=1 Tax=Ostrinia furnacalis TaxID=93504 RepID=UPI00103BE4FC|nr:gastrula zinc finger protein XlCGF8.2DB-like [Ostrinia furnacalis]
MVDVMDDNICRICFHRQDTLFSLFRKIKGSSPYEKLVKKTQLKIELNDTGPASICSQCLIELDTTVSFLEKCEKSNHILAAKLSQSIVLGDVKTNVSAIRHEETLFHDSAEHKYSEKTEFPIEYDIEDNSFTQTPIEIEPAKCSECGSLRRCKHWAPPTSFICQYCSKVFTRKFNFKLHLKRHLGEKDWPCTTCGVRLLTRWLAQRHCAPKPRRSCPVPGCGKTFTTNTNLTTHMRVHSGERPHVCTECGKSFTSKNTLNDHFRIHTGAKPYICPVCGRRFTTNKLAAHLRTHSGARPHACPLPACPRAFRTRRALRLHAATHAPPARAHACTMCEAAYNHKQSLRKHMRQRHAQENQPSESV